MKNLELQSGVFDGGKWHRDPANALPVNKRVGLDNNCLGMEDINGLHTSEVSWIFFFKQ